MTLIRTKQLLIALATSMVFVTAAQADSIDQRQANQANRIAHGFATCELTLRETARMINGQQQLRRMERRAEADGVVTRYENARLHSKANIESHKIARNKHDRQGC